MFEECRVEGEFTLSSGRKSDVFYDFDLLNPREAANYVEHLLRQTEDLINWEEVDFIAAPALGGIVPAFLVSFAKGKPLVIVDKENKPRGPEFKVGRYIIVDDVITSFQAANRVRSVLKDCQCIGAMSYIFRGSWEDLTRQEYPAYYLARKEQEKI